jgi:general secretion pathway protein C
MSRPAIWIANGAFLVLICFFAARILTEVAAGAFAPPSGSTVTGAAPGAVAARPAGERPQIILARNLFRASTEEAEAPAPEDEVYEKTKLPLRLLGTAALAEAALSWAAVEDLDDRKHLVVRVKDELKGRAEVVRIERRRIVLRNGGRLEELGLDETSAGGGGGAATNAGPGSRRFAGRPPPVPPPPGEMPSSGPDALVAPSRGSVQRLGSDRYAVAREDFEDVAVNPAQLFSQARILPKYVEGEMVGVQLNSIKSGSVFEEMGIRDGDTITELNGIRISSQQDSAKVLRELSGARDITATVMGSDGRTRRVTYEIQ